MKNTYLIKSTKQIFKIGDQVIIQQTSAYTQEKFISRCRGLFEIVAILGNSTYKLADEHETLKASINRDLLKLYKSYDFMKPIVVIN